MTVMVYVTSMAWMNIARSVENRLTGKMTKRNGENMTVKEIPVNIKCLEYRQDIQPVIRDLVKV